MIPDPTLIPDIRPLIKQRGGLLAKGRLLGIQFDALFTDGLYFQLGRHAVDLAMVLKAGLAARGYVFDGDSTTNEQIQRLGREFSFDDTGAPGSGPRSIRFCTSWATTREQVDRLLAAL